MHCPVAVLIDGDNVRPEFGEQIRTFSEGLGRLDIARVYGGAHPASDWLTFAGYRFVFAGAGKNAADLLLSIDAIEMLHHNEIKTFVLASSDGDFSHLAYRLRERGRQVFGFGETKTPMSFRAACTEFSVLATIKEITQPKKPSQQAENFTSLDENIRNVISLHSKNGEGIRIVDLAPQMYRKHGTKISSHPEGTWRAYLSKRITLYRLDPRGPNARVRFISEGFSKL